MDGKQLIAALQELSDFERGLPVVYIPDGSGNNGIERLIVQRYDGGRLMVCLRP